MTRDVLKLNRLEAVMNSLDNLLNTSGKRHVAGGILMSTSLLFAGLAITIISLKHSHEKGDK